MQAMGTRIRHRDFGVVRCRDDRWEDGFTWLVVAFDDGMPDGPEWAIAASYLAVCMARFTEKRDQGVKLCRRAAKAAMFEPEVWLNLARLHHMAHDRRGTVEALERGLSLIPGEFRLDRMRAQIGRRAPTPLGFLPREHPLNRRLGKLRAALVGGG